LNPYGDGVYCRFLINDFLDFRGLYSFALNTEIKYIGKVQGSTFAKRINQGYGRIDPKNCYLDGQATNCHLNNLINQCADGIEFYICPLDDEEKIDRFEKILIRNLNPEWNIALKPKS